MLITIKMCFRISCLAMHMLFSLCPVSASPFSQILSRVLCSQTLPSPPVVHYIKGYVSLCSMKWSYQSPVSLHRVMTSGKSSSFLALCSVFNKTVSLFLFWDPQSQGTNMCLGNFSPHFRSLMGGQVTSIINENANCLFIT